MDVGLVASAKPVGASLQNAHDSGETFVAALIPAQ